MRTEHSYTVKPGVLDDEAFQMPVIAVQSNPLVGVAVRLLREIQNRNFILIIL